jgi:predicted Fe-Mo cluster-binding NifX family protein
MSKVGFTTLLNREDSVLSPHFGMAKWVMIRDDDTGEITFEQNTGLTGRAVADILAHHGCTDAVFTEIGPGALGHLRAAGIRGWLAPTDVPVPELVERLSQGALPAVNEATQSAGGARRRERRGGECGSTESRGTGAGRERGCCGQQRHNRQCGTRT